MEGPSARPDQKRVILVIGAGVIGLTTAIRLREAGHEVRVLAAETPSTIISRATTVLKSDAPSTYTSSGAGGLWMPFMLSGDKVSTWATRTFAVLAQEASLDVGVDMLEGFLLQATRTSPPLPWYAGLTQMTVQTAADDARIPREYAAALRFRAPVVQMGRYLMRLERAAAGLGVCVELTAAHTRGGEARVWGARQVGEFVRREYAGRAAQVVVVNCCGVGAGALAGETMEVGRGVTVRVRRPKGVRHFISEDVEDGLLSSGGRLAYAIPRGEEYTLGGSLEKGEWAEEATGQEVEGVVQRAGRLVAGVAEMERLGTWAGLRPMRKEGRARVEVQEEGLGGAEGGEMTVVGNYGHSGSGVTLCWGCAEEVVRIVAGLGGRGEG